MTKHKKENADNIPQKQNDNSGQNRKSGILFGLLAFLTALIVIVSVAWGVFYLIIHNNVNGLADKNRKSISKIPILRMALPKPPEGYDPYDPKNLNEKELLNYYNQLRKENKELTDKLSESNKTVKELEGLKSELEGYKSEIERIKAENETIKENVKLEKASLEEYKKKVDEIVASGDKEGFKEFFAKVNKDTAAKVYEEILKEQQANEEEKKFAQIYEKMDASDAAKIFEELGSSGIDLVVRTLLNMKKEVAAEVLAQMDKEFAAKVTEKLSKEFGITF